MFADPDFDGSAEQDASFNPGKNGEIPDILGEPEMPPEQPDEPNAPETPHEGEGVPGHERRMEYYVDNVEVTVLRQRVQYIDKDGKLINESLTDYTRRNVRNQYATLDDMQWQNNFKRWIKKRLRRK